MKDASGKLQGKAWLSALTNSDNSDLTVSSSVWFL